MREQNLQQVSLEFHSYTQPAAEIQNGTINSANVESSDTVIMVDKGITVCVSPFRHKYTISSVIVKTFFETEPNPRVLSQVRPSRDVELCTQSRDFGCSKFELKLSEFGPPGQLRAETRGLHHWISVVS